MVKFFNWCGYTVNSPNNLQRPVLNIVDIALVLIYTVLSFRNLLIAKPSVSILIINVVILLRLILKNVIEQGKIADSQDDKNKDHISIVYIVKIVLEACTLILLLAFFIWSVNVTGDLSIVKFIAGVVLVLSFFDNIWTIFERLYDAIPRSLSY